MYFDTKLTITEKEFTLVMSNKIKTKVALISGKGSYHYIHAAYCSHRCHYHIVSTIKVSGLLCLFGLPSANSELNTLFILLRGIKGMQRL